MVTGEANGVLHPSVLRIMSAQRASDSLPIEIINFSDLNKTRAKDYGVTRTLKLDDRQGPVRYGVIGMQKGIIRWQYSIASFTLSVSTVMLPLASTKFAPNAPKVAPQV